MLFFLVPFAVWLALADDSKTLVDYLKPGNCKGLWRKDIKLPGRCFGLKLESYPDCKFCAGLQIDLL
jgi:hypothetical protein